MKLRSVRVDLPPSRPHPLPGLLPSSTLTPVQHSPCSGCWTSTLSSMPDVSSSPFTRGLLSRGRRILFACVAADRVLFTLLPTRPRGDAVAFELSTFSWIQLGRASHPAAACGARWRSMALDGARWRSMALESRHSCRAVRPNTTGMSLLLETVLESSVVQTLISSCNVRPLNNSGETFKSPLP